MKAFEITDMANGQVVERQGPVLPVTIRRDAP